MNEEHRDNPTWPRKFEEITNYVQVGDKQLKELEKLVHDRLWSVDSASSQPYDFPESTDRN
jgi:hypothetical protein